MKVEPVPTWAALKARVAELRAEAKEYSKATKGTNQSELLFRGQGSSEWKLETSFDRAAPKNHWLEDYYSMVVAAKTVTDSLRDSDIPELNLDLIHRLFREQDFFTHPLPYYDVLVRLRHHGFPSPLLDWSRSFYVVSYFAFEQPQPQDKDRSVAIYIYQEFTGTPKTHLNGEPQLVSFGPWVRTHARHVLQQSQYTIAVQRESSSWKIMPHEDVFAVGSVSQDRLIKLVVPSSEAAIAMEELDEMNINAYSLFQTEDSLFRTLGRRLFQC
jgi:FRG domain